MFRRTVQGCWLPTPFASFPFTFPPARHCVPSGSERAITVISPAQRWLHERASLFRYTTLPALFYLLATLSANLYTVHRSKNAFTWFSDVVCILRVSNVATFQLSVRANSVNNNICIYYIAIKNSSARLPSEGK